MQNKCLEYQYKYDEGIQHLNINKNNIIDKYSMKIKLAEYYLYTKQYIKAKESWLHLTLYQIDNYKLHIGLQCSYLMLSPQVSIYLINTLKKLELPSSVIILTPEQREILIQLYNNKDESIFNTSNSKSSQTIINKILLTCYDNNSKEFYTLLESYIKGHISEGIPSLYHDVCDLIRGDNNITNNNSITTTAAATATTPTTATSTNNNDNNNNATANNTSSEVDVEDSSDKTHSNILYHQNILITDIYDFKHHHITIYIKSLLETYIENLGNFSKFSENDTNIESPTALLWCMFLYTHILIKSGDYTEALIIINKCINHTPTALDMYLLKSKILKKLGNVLEASDVSNQGRILDTQDRYLNNKCVKYMLQAGYISEAMDTIAMFTKDSTDPQKTLYDLQANW